MGESLLSYALPVPPCGNNFYTVARGRKIISGKGRQWRDVARHAIQQVCCDTHYQMPRNRVSVSIYYQVPDRRKRDIDGIIKAVLDAGKLGGAYPDDSIIKELHVYKEPPKKGERGSIVVVVRGR